MRGVSWRAWTLVAALGVLPAGEGAAQTSYYRCTDDYGRPVFSQRPCGEDATRKTVVSQPRQAAPDARVQPDEAPPVAAPPAADNRQGGWDKIEASNRLRDVRREIWRLEGEVSDLEAERDAKIAALDRNRHAAANNLAGATYLESLAREKQGVISQYESRVNSLYREIERLEREQDELRRKHDL